MPYNLREPHQPFLTPMAIRDSHELEFSSASHSSQTLFFNNKNTSLSAPQVQQFLTFEEVQLISQKLHLPQTRISALQSLSTEEALHNAVEHWELLKSGLRSCLVIPKTSSLSLQIHLRIMKVDHLSAKESYISMTEALMEIYESSSIQEQGATILKALVDYNRMLPSNWIRFPETYIEAMASSFMNLLSILPKNDKCVPLQIMCMVDPGSAWIREWFLSDFGRNIILKSIPLNLLIYLSQESTGILKTYPSSTWEKLSKAKNGVLDEPLLSYSVFLTSINFTCQCLKYKKSRQRLIYELGRETPLDIFKEIIEFLIKTPTSLDGPLEFIAKTIGEVIEFNQSWIIQEYLINTKLLSKTIQSLKEFPSLQSQSPSCKYICMLLKHIYATQSDSLLKEEQENNNEALARFCISAFQSHKEEESEIERMLSVIELSSAFLSQYPKSIQEFNQSLVDSMCHFVLKTSKEQLIHSLSSTLADLFLKNPLHAKTISKFKKLLVSLFKRFNYLQNHPRVWMVDLDLCISEGLLNLTDLQCIEDASLDPWDERDLWDWATEFEVILCSVSASNAPHRTLFNLEELIHSNFRLLTSLSYLSVDFYIFLEITYNLRQKYKDLCSEMGQVIDEDSLRLKYFLHYTESLGSLTEKSLDKLNIAPEFYSSIQPTKICSNMSGEENEGEEENDFLRILEILEEDQNWLTNARERFESIPSDVRLSRRTLHKVFDRAYSRECKEPARRTPCEEDQRQMTLIISLFQGYKEISDKSLGWEKELRELHSLFGSDSAFNWHMASLYFSTGFEMTKRVLAREDFTFSRERFHYFSEMILFHEDPLLYSFLTQRSILPSIVFEKWAQTSFFNVLPWKEIRRYLALLTVFDFSYMLFLCIAIFRHHRLDILQAKDEPEVLNTMERISLFSVSDDFSIGQYLSYMKLLSQKYKVSLKSEI